MTRKSLPRFITPDSPARSRSNYRSQRPSAVPTARGFFRIVLVLLLVLVIESAESRTSKNDDEEAPGFAPTCARSYGGQARTSGVRDRHASDYATKQLHCWLIQIEESRRITEDSLWSSGETGFVTRERKQNLLVWKTSPKARTLVCGQAQRSAQSTRR